MYVRVCVRRTHHTNVRMVGNLLCAPKKKKIYNRKRDVTVGHCRRRRAAPLSRVSTAATSLPPRLATERAPNRRDPSITCCRRRRQLKTRNNNTIRTRISIYCILSVLYRSPGSAARFPSDTIYTPRVRTGVQKPKTTESPRALPPVFPSKPPRPFENETRDASRTL